MRVDIDTYRRMDVGSHGCSVMLSSFVYGRIINWLGSLTLIRLLLFMAGVEQNPGPVDEYIFHYQYLLIEIGSDVIRKIFDARVGYNFGKYLAKNTKEGTKLQSLIWTKIITPDQTQHLPPIDNNPKSTNFDITLLACLLRNVCGLRAHNDLVWKKPQPTDFSLEADLARLKECRNNLQHMGTVQISATTLKIKWVELSQIMTRLNNTARIQNLSKVINDVKKMALDVQLKQNYDDAIKTWNDSDKLIDRGIEDLQYGQSEIIRRQSTIEDSLSEIDQCQYDIKQGISEVIKGQKQQKEVLQELRNTHRINTAQVETIAQTYLDGGKQTLTLEESDLRNRLIKLYQEECCTLPVSPLCLEDEEEIELLTIYQRPNMSRIPYHRSEQEKEKYRIHSYRQLLFKDYQGECIQCFTNIYITGDAGVGKTSFCKCMALLWSKQGQSIGNRRLKKDVKLMQMFDFVFYISLRKTVHEDVIDMIIDQCFYTKSKDTRAEIVTLVEHILKHKICLIILDGLDEWSPHIKETKYCELPKKIPSDMCVYLTTSRPYKIENTRLSQKDLDIQVHMTGLSKQSTIVLVKQIVNHINDKTRNTNNPDDFIRDIRRLGLQNQLRIPLLAVHMIEVWFDHTLVDMSRALLYSNIVNMLLKRAVKRKITFPRSIPCSVPVPDALKSLCYVKRHFSLLERISLLSFRSLFKQGANISALVFSEEQLMSLPYFPTEDELNYLCKIGIISLNKVIGTFGKQEQQLSFLHRSYLEFFAALFVSSFDLNNEFANVVKTWTSINDVVQHSHFFRFLAGFSYPVTKHYIDKVYEAISEDLTSCRRNAIFHYDSEIYSKGVKSLQNMVVSCFTDISTQNDATISCRLEDFVFENHDNDTELLKQLLMLNKAHVRSIRSVNGKYLDEFGGIQNLECLHVENLDALSTDQFYISMLRNCATLCVVSIDGGGLIPTRNLQCLTSLSLTSTTMVHYNLLCLVKFLSEHRHMENIKLMSVICCDHREKYCTVPLDLSLHTKLTSLYLRDVNVVCKNVNTSSLLSITLFPLCQGIVRCYTDIFTNTQYSNLEHIDINGRELTWLDTNMKNALFQTIKALPKIKLLKLENMEIPNDVLIKFHAGIQRTYIQLCDVRMTESCFQYFINHLLENGFEVNCVLSKCKLTRLLGDVRTLRPISFSEKTSLGCMADILKGVYDRHARNSIKFHTYENDCQLYFETTQCQ